MNITSDIWEYTDQVFKDVSLQQDEIESKEFYDCTFVACSFSETIFKDCRFVTCTFMNCDLSLMRVPGCAFTNTKFEDSKMIGVDWTDAVWPKEKLLEPITFSKCVINHSTFIGLSLPEIKIVECIAHEVDFREANLPQADFSHTDLSGSLVINTNLTQADFTHARNYAINASLNTLKKTRFSLPEAMSLLHSLDIVLTE